MESAAGSDGDYRGCRVTIGASPAPSGFTQYRSAMKYYRCLAVVPFLVVLQSPLPAQEVRGQGETEEQDPLEGHSHQGHAFNEGPRQAAYLMGGTGNVSFPVTTSSAQAQAFFNQGIGQLHGFWYFEAERSFRQMLQIDPDCAMAYWGMCLANTNNAQRAASLIYEALLRKDAVGEKERMWIEGYAAYYQVSGCRRCRHRPSSRRAASHRAPASAR